MEVSKENPPLGAAAAAQPATRVLLGLFALALLLPAVALVFVWSTRQSNEADMARVSFGWFTLIVIVAVLVGRPAAFPIVERLVAPVRASPKRAGLLLTAAILVGLLLVARVVLDAFPNSGDEYSYILQAETYARGRLWVEPPQPGNAFQMMRFVAKNGRWLSIYQPGWPAVLALPIALGVPAWLVSPVLGALATWMFFRLASRLVRPEAAWLATLGVCTSSFFLLNFGSFVSHGSGALAAVLFAWCGVRYLEDGAPRWGLLAGLCLGALGFIRAINAIFLVGPFVVAVLLTPRRRMGLIWLALGGLPFAFALLAYNQAITGHPLLAVQAWVARGREPLGAPTPQSMFETGRRIVRLYLWTSPVFVVGWPLAFIMVALKKRLSFVDWLAPLTVLGFAAYGGDGGNQYGPRYYFEGWPFAFITVAKAIEPIFTERTHKLTEWLSVAVVCHLGFQLGYLGPRIQREHACVLEREDVYTQVAAAGVSNAVVLIADSPSDFARVIRILPSRDLIRNGLEIGDEPVTYAVDKNDETNALLRQRFPDRKFYRYYHRKLISAMDATGALLPKPADAF